MARTIFQRPRQKTACTNLPARTYWSDHKGFHLVKLLSESDELKPHQVAAVGSRARARTA
eukprot:6160978-Pleurochrysis_carterae.AAC.3